MKKDILIDGGETRNRLEIPPIEKPNNCVDMTNIHWYEKLYCCP